MIYKTLLIICLISISLALFSINKSIEYGFMKMNIRLDTLCDELNESHK